MSERDQSGMGADESALGAINRPLRALPVEFGDVPNIHVLPVEFGDVPNIHVLPVGADLSRPAPIHRPSAAHSEIDLTNIRELRNLLYAHNMRPNKSFGQNFLVDRAVLQQIVEAAQLAPDDTVLEVGAGMGVLTRELAKWARRVVAVELERDMLELLEETIRGFTNVELVARNLLYLDPSEVFGREPYKLVANLPYYITAPTFRHFLESTNPPRLLVVMVQYEVAQRIVAEPGDLSLLGVSVQFYGRPEIIARVPASAFYPTPKVDSAILRINVYDQESAPRKALSQKERDTFFRVVQAGFSEKRKQLHNSLARGLHCKDEKVKELLSAVNIDASRRAETLSIEEWLDIAKELDQQKLCYHIHNKI